MIVHNIKWFHSNLYNNKKEMLNSTFVPCDTIYYTRRDTVQVIIQAT